MKRKLRFEEIKEIVSCFKLERNIFMAEIETKLIQKSETKPREWKRFIDDIFSLWNCDTKGVDRFIKRANYSHPTIKFTAEMSEKQITFLDTTVF